jgi:hypothetical protein
MSRTGWEAVTFSAMTFEDVESLLEMSTELSAATYGTGHILDRMAAVLTHVR